MDTSNKVTPMERLCIWLPVPISELDFNNNNWLQFQFVKSWEHYTKNKVGGGILVDYCVQNSVRCTYTGALTHRGNTQPHTPIPTHTHPLTPIPTPPLTPTHTPPHTHSHTYPHTHINQKSTELVRVVEAEEMTNNCCVQQPTTEWH